MSFDLVDRTDLFDLEMPRDLAATQTARVLHVINGEHYSGAERVQDLLAQRLGEFGFTVDFACLKPGMFEGLRQARDAHVFNAPMHRRVDMRPLFALARLIHDHDYVLVHTHTARSALVGRLAARLAGVPHVHHLHSPTSQDTTRWLANRVNMAIERVSLNRAAGLIAVSHSLGEYARRHRLGGGVLAVVPNGVPIQGELCDRPLPRGTWTLGAVALFRPRKGLEVLLETLAKLKARGLAVRLRAVGGFEDAAYEYQIKSLADKLGVTSAIDWVGFTSNVSGELAKMDLFVLPSLFGEGLPMVVLEAMAAGVPVVATRVEGVPEAIRDTLDGLLATPGDADDLADRIADVVQGDIDWQSLRASAHARQAERFSDRSMAAAVANVYRRVLSPAVEDETLGAPQQTIRLLGTRIDNLTMPEAVATLVEKLDADEPTQVAFVNADCINITYRNADYARVLSQADLVLPDGVGLRIAGKVLGQPVRDNVNGTDLFPRLCMALNHRGKRIYLLGGKPDVAEGVARWIRMHFAGIEVCGAHDGYFAPEEDAKVVREIAASHADLLLVALGAPRQDLWIREHLAATGCRVAMGVGGLFDFYSHRIPRAPRWIRRYSLEWAYRVWQEPRRLAKRYLLGNPLFLYRVLRERCRGGGSRFRQRAIRQCHHPRLAKSTPDPLNVQAFSARS
jgi:exopolysaccharide biosynthesis WecB/TagA/CpsF family protein